MMDQNHPGLPVSTETSQPEHIAHHALSIPSWQVQVESPSRYETPPGGGDRAETSETLPVYSTSQTITMPTPQGLSTLGGMPLTADHQNFLSLPGSLQPVFNMPAVSYEGRIEDYTSMLTSTALQGNMGLTLPPQATLQHIQQVLQQVTDRKNLPPHLQVVPLFDPGTGLTTIPRTIPLTQVSIPAGFGTLAPSSIGLGVSSANQLPAINPSQIGGLSALSTNINPLTSADSLRDPLAPHSLPVPKEQLVSHPSNLSDREHIVSQTLMQGAASSPNNGGLTQTSLYPMIPLGSYRSADVSTEAAALMIGSESEHEQNLHLGLSDDRKPLSESYVAGTGETDGTPTSHPSAFQPVHHADSGETYHTPDGTNINMSHPLDVSTLHAASSAGSMAATGMTSLPSSIHSTHVNGHLSSGDIDTASMMPPGSNDMHLLAPVSQSLLNLGVRPVLDPLVGPNEASMRGLQNSLPGQEDSDDDHDNIKGADNSIQHELSSYTNAEQDMFMPRKSLRIAERQRTPSPRPMYVPKEYYSINEMWCEECQTTYVPECQKHRQMDVYDKLVLSRAWATLPNQLQIFRLGETSELGVFARKQIPARTRFGPFFAPLVDNPDLVTNKRFLLKLENEDGSQYFLEASDENSCNWMMFVRAAESFSEQNLVAFQYKTDIFFTSTKTIEAKQELKVWYAPPYAARLGAPIFQPSEEEIQEMDLASGKWPCYECNMNFRSSALLQKHLSIHDNYMADMGDDDDDDGEEIYGDDRNGKRTRKRGGRGGKGATRAKTKKIKELVGEDSTVFQSWKKRKTNMYLNKLKKYREPIKRSLMTLYKKQGKEGNEWMCTHCELTFDNPSLLNLHTLTHAAEDLALVDLNSTFNPQPDATQPTELFYPSHDNTGTVESVQPVLLQWDESNLKCPVCDKIFSTKQELILHASEHARKTRRQLRFQANKPYKCLTCWKSFTTDERLQRHQLCHNENTHKPFMCLVCSKGFMTNSALACHKKIHSDKKYYDCPICHLGFDQVNAMKKHVLTHAVNGMYDCPHCHKSFPNYNLIRRHIRGFHSDNIYRCTECGKEFPRADKLKIHMVKHSNAREFMCDICGRQFKRKDKLREHTKRMHDPNRERKPRVPVTKIPKFSPKFEPSEYNRFIYKCETCLLGFKRRGMLVNHLAKRHPDIKPDDIPELNLPILRTQRDYFCQYCDKVYKSSSKRKMHILKYHPGGEVPPSIRMKNGIDKIDIHNASYSQPAASVTTMPHQCELCHKQYASKAKLLQHQRKKHDVHEDMGSMSKRCLQLSSDIQTIQGSTILDKPRLLAAIIQKPMMDSAATELITIAPHMQGLETLQNSDLLTQAMSELTPALSEFRHQSPVGTVEYQLAATPGGTTTLVQHTGGIPTGIPQSIDLNQLVLNHSQNQSQLQLQRGTSQVYSASSLGPQISTSGGTITVMSSSQAAQVLAGTLPVTLSAPYLQKQGLVWSTAAQNYR